MSRHNNSKESLKMYLKIKAIRKVLNRYASHNDSFHDVVSSNTGDVTCVSMGISYWEAVAV